MTAHPAAHPAVLPPGSVDVHVPGKPGVVTSLRSQGWWLWLVVCGVLMLAWLTGSSLLNLVAFEDKLTRLHQASRVNQEVLGLVLDAETGQRGYLLVGRAEFLEPYHGAVRELRDARDRLDHLLDDPPSRNLLGPLNRAIDDRLELLGRGLAEAGRRPDRPAVNPLADDGKVAMDRVRALSDQIHQHQVALMSQLNERHAETVSHALLTTASAFVANVVLLGLLLMRAHAAARTSGREAHLAQVQNEELSQLLALSARQNQQMHDLSELARYLQSCRDVAEATAVLAQRLPGLMSAPRGGLYLMAASRNQLRLAFAWGLGGFDDTIEPQACWALRSGQPFTQPDACGATACAHLHGEPASQLAGMQCLPMAAHGELSGLLVLGAPATAEAVVDDALARLRATALEQVGLSLGNLALRETLRQQSIRDTLTGLVNRRYLDEALSREVLRAGRRASEGQGGSVAVLMVDVDHFKRFNDTHGHEVGDRVLRAVAQCMQRAARVSDLVARYGGEEFTVVMADLPAEVAWQRAEALRAAVADLPTHTEGHEHGPVTISIGLALYPQDAPNPETLLARADRALYTAKRAGRNRVHRYRDLPELEAGELPEPPVRLALPEGPTQGQAPSLGPRVPAG